MSQRSFKPFVYLFVFAIVLSAISGLSILAVQALPGKSVTETTAHSALSVTSVDLSTYVRVSRFDLPEPTRTAHPPNSLLAQEVSAVTYNWDTDTLFVVGDGGTSVVQVTKTGQFIDSMTLAPGPSPQGTDFYDTEGLTYVGGGKFVLMEERYRQASLFTYTAGGILHKTDVQSVKLGTTIGNIGLEGISFDPLTNGYICVKEKDPESIFQTGIDFAAGTATNGSPTATSSTDLFNPALANLADFSDVFALSNLPSLNGQPDYSHLLVLSQESGQIVNIDRSGTVFSRLTIVSDPGNPLSVADQTHEGLTMDRGGNLYVVSENGGGDSAHPQLWVYAPSTASNQAPTAVTLNNTVTSIPENTSTAAPVKMAEIVVTDDGLGNNTLYLTGPDAGSFQITGTALYLKAGTPLNLTSKPIYNINVNVDDTTVGVNPDATVNFTLMITAPTSGTAQLIISEVAPWSSGNSSLAADWFEVTNIGTASANITGWTMDDNSNSFGSSVALNGITSIAPGESVIFIELSGGHTAAGDAANFRSIWFGASPPANLQIGSYGGSGVGLSTGGDAVNLFDASGTVQAHVEFGANAPAGPYPTFDNATGLNNATISALSAVGVNGAFSVSDTVGTGQNVLIGSPGTIGASSTPVVTIVATDANAAEEGMDPGTFRISRTGSRVSPLTVSYTIATGAGQATSDDYTPALTGAATIPSGQPFVDIVITPKDDSEVEGTETLTLTLGDTGSYDVGVPATATVTILDDTANRAPTAVVLSNTVSYIVESASTASAIKVADIAVTDDGKGPNVLSLTGPDAAFFQITGLALFLKAGTSLSYASKPTYKVAVNVDDATVGSTPDAIANFTLTITQAVPAGSIIVSEVAPWSSSNSPPSLAADWFEVTNIGATAISTTGWKMDDNSNLFNVAVPLNGVPSIAPGESVIFIETTDLTAKSAAFKSLWFGANSPAGLQIGSYTGSGVGLSSSGDAVNLFDASGNLITGVSFGASLTGPSFATFDNSAGLGSTTFPVPSVSTLSAVGVNGAFVAVNDSTEIGSPGTITNLFLGVAAGDADASSAVLWTRVNRAQSLTITAQLATDPGFPGTPVTFTGTSDATRDFTVKIAAKGLLANTRYYYRFVINSTGETSGTGTFKTAPLPNVAAPVHFAFSGDNDGLMRPFALANVIPAQRLDFYLNLGDVIYETASNLTVSGPHNSQPWLNSPNVTLSNDSLSFNGIPRAVIQGSAPFATQAQLKSDYEKKYRENFLPVNIDGQNSLQVLYAAQGNYTAWDNHELGNRKYIDGGAPAGGSVGGVTGTDMPTGRGVDARAYTGSNTGGSGNINNVNDAADLLSSTDLANLGGFMNRAIGFQTLENVFLAYQPIADRGVVNASGDPRTNGTRQLYFAVPWGRNVLFVNTDSRSYRDIRLKTNNATADDTGPRADNPNRTYLGVTQLAWLKQTLLDAQNNGTTWKFVSISDPIDQLGPIGGALAGTLTSVNSDGGKSYMGGYRAERNDLLKFIADNKITNVVFLATDDHQNRINELYYSPSGQTNVQSSYVKVPYTFSIVCGPLGATGPDAITDHSFANIKAIADTLAAAQTAAGIDPVGLQNYPGLHDLVREGDPTAGTNPQAVDFYSPDTFNFTVLDVSANGKTLTVKSVGMNSTAQNAGIEYANGPQARTIFSFQIDGLNQTINFAQLAEKTFGDAPFAVSATASSGLPVSFAASGNCAVSGSVVTLTASGTCTITASQTGDSNFSPALAVSQTFSIAKAETTMTIIADTPDPSVVGQSVTVNYQVSAKAPGGGTPTGNVTITDGADSCTGTVAAGSCVLTLITTGARTLRATYSGDANFNASSSPDEPHQVRTKVDIDQVNPNSAFPGERITMTVIGHGFVPQSKISIDGLGLTILSRYVSSTKLMATVIVSANAFSSLRDVTVTNPDGGSSTKGNAFTVR